MKTIACCVVAVMLAACQPTEKPPAASPAVQPSTLSTLKPRQPTRTKAVRIFVVPEREAKDAKLLNQFMRDQRAAANDVFIVGSEAHAYVDGRLQPVSDAMQANWEAVPTVDVTAGEQLQWQSEAEFEISGIQKVTERVSTRRPPLQGTAKPEMMDASWSFEVGDAMPDNPFPRLSAAKPAVAVALGQGQKTIRTGAYDLSGQRQGQLYLLSATITVGSERRTITPGLYVFACGLDSGCHRRVGIAGTTPNRSKVVRLIVVPDTMKDPAEILKLGETYSLSTCDALIVGGKPMYILKNQLVDHEKALTEDFDSAALIMVEELEQLQWESNVDFNVQAIEKKGKPGEKPITTIRDGSKWEFEKRGDAPENPFDLEVGSRTKLRRSIRSGVAVGFLAAGFDRVRNRDGQLYKVTFTMMIGGKPQTVDPDTVCDMS